MYDRLTHDERRDVLDLAEQASRDFIAQHLAVPEHVG
jgi:hypothetical protein